MDLYREFVQLAGDDRAGVDCRRVITTVVISPDNRREVTGSPEGRRGCVSRAG